LGREMSLGQQRDYSEHTAAMIDEEVQSIIEERYHYVKQILTQNRLLLDKMSEMLLEHETIDAKDVLALQEQFGETPVKGALVS